MFALIDMWVISCKELQQLVISLLREALLENMNGFLRPEVVSATLSWTSELAQSALTDDDVKVIVQALKAKAMLARQCAATLHFMLDQTNRTLKHRPVLLALPLELIYQLAILVINVSDAPLSRSQILCPHNTTQIRLAQICRAACNFCWAANVRQAAQRDNLF